MPWRRELKNNIRTVEQLKQYVDLTPKQKKQLKKVIEKHPMSITRYYMSLIEQTGVQHIVDTVLEKDWLVYQPRK
jgi:L-lysine 2,3-aminomutase